MKKNPKLAVKKVTLRDLDESHLEGVDGACCPTVVSPTCATCNSCVTKCGQHTCSTC
jgi:hypothetical protein